MAEVIYTAVFLTTASKKLLLERVPPVHPEVHADHMTILFRPSELELANTPIGLKVQLRIDSVVADSKGQAVEVSGVLSHNLCPHITISVEREKGGTPNYSNALLLRRDGDFLSPPLLLEGVIDTFPRSIKEEGTNG